MCKLTIAGPKTKRSDVVELLHKKGVLHIEDYVRPADEVELDIGSSSSNAKELSEILLKTRSIKSHLNIGDKCSKHDSKRAMIKNPAKEIERINKEVFEYFEEIKSIDNSLIKLNSQKDIVGSISMLGLSADAFVEYDNLFYVLGYLPKNVNVQTIMSDVSSVEKTSQSYFLQDKANGRIVFAVFAKKESDDKIMSILSTAGFVELSLKSVELTGDNSISDLKSLNIKIRDFENRKEKLKTEIDSLGKNYASFIIDTEKKYTSELEILEAPLRFAESKNAFVIEGWVPKKNYELLKKDIDEISNGKIYIEKSKSTKGAPTELVNPKMVRPFEFFMDLYSLPKQSEIDPTFFMFLTFPLFFGFMLGDLGYGILTFVLFWAVKRKINSKELKPVLSVMMFASFMTAVFGYIFGEFFGSEYIFGYHMHPIFHRLHDPVGLLTISVLMGVVHVNMGLIIGFYNELKAHGIKAAILEKLGWIVLQVGGVVLATGQQMIGGVLLLMAVVMIGLGEGVKGLLELPSILANILSYSRLMAVGLASAILALVVNEMAGVAFAGGGVGVVMGVVILVAGHTIAILLGMLSPFIHSMRLHYVEFFMKFYRGGGKKYVPFGAKD